MSDCILGDRIGKNGYARIPGGKRGVRLYAHRAAWEQKHGPIPEGMHIHHRCHNKTCVNVDHLELLIPKEHYAQHRNCDHADRREKPNGRTECRECRRQRERDRYANDPIYRAREQERAREAQRRRRGVV